MYGLDRQSAAVLPVWERDLLVAAGRQLLNLDDDAGAGGELSDADVARIVRG